MTQLTKNFQLDEFKVSDDFPKLAQEMDINPFKRILLLLCQTILQPLRESLDSPITIISGIRMAKLNSKINGSFKSDHLYGMAADFTTNNLLLANEKIIDDIKNYRQVIIYPMHKFIHVSINKIAIKPFKNDALISLDKINYLPFITKGSCY